MRLRLFFIFNSILMLGREAFADDIRDIKPPVGESSGFWWMIFAVAVVLAGVLLFLKFSAKPTEQREVLSAAERALRNLSSLESAKKGLGLGPYYSQLSDIVRRFMEEQYGIDAPEMTTEEFLNSVKTTEKLPDATRALLKEFLTSCDMVKFAKYQPGSAEVEGSFALAKNFIEQSQ